ncbi:MAG: DNA starvation/stationary phase protection protein, partial [Bacteroidia bacterium]|nr:DNA starvation/stationary phase protection protein [Bacteroidia bacterium]MDW8332741.1 DNA starvation/stationary phase protection protein [Bacteroidia bacterium]
FEALHELFGKQYDELSKQADDIAERIRALGGFANATLSAHLRATRLKEAAEDSPEAEAMIGELSADREALARYVRGDLKEVQAAGDEGTADLLVECLKTHEKAAWLLRSHLE